MKIKIITILLFSTICHLSAQTDEEIIRGLQHDLFSYGLDTIWLDSYNFKIISDLDSSYLADYSDLKIPHEIINDWKKNSQYFHVSSWDESLLNKVDTFFFQSDTIFPLRHIFRCISESELDKLFKNRLYFKKFYSLSKIIFDNSRENAILHMTFKQSDFHFSSETIIIKKIFGKWILVSRFGTSVETNNASG
jgi:hypothetical protein